MRITVIALGTARVVIGLHSGSLLLSLTALCGAQGTVLVVSRPMSAPTDGPIARDGGRGTSQA